MADSEPLTPGVPVLAETALADRLERPAPVLVLFYADWCPFCEAFMPTFREVNEGTELAIAAANISHPEDPRWETHSIEAVPTLIAFEAGDEIDRLEAVQGQGLTREAYEAFLAGARKRLTGA